MGDSKGNAKENLEGDLKKKVLGQKDLLNEYALVQSQAHKKTKSKR